MKKTIITLAAVALMGIGAQAQRAAIEAPNFWSNWSIGIDGGVTTPANHGAFFGDMRGTVGLHVQKQATPLLALGVEGNWAVNTSSWRGQVHSATAFDRSYVGAYGALNLCNLFGGYQCQPRCFSMEVVLGSGWGHYYQTSKVGPDANYFATKVGLNFNFSLADRISLSLKPSVTWNMTDGYNGQSTASYNINRATYDLAVALNFGLGQQGFACVERYDQGQIDALNGTINDLRGQLDDAAAAAALMADQNAALAADLAACQGRKPEVVKEVTNNLNSVRYVFYRNGSSVITADQQPNVEMIATYLKNHPQATVVIKGYASADGPAEFNAKLAAARAQSVRDALVNKYKIAANRITAEGEGIGHMFEEESWNRVSICTLETSQK